MSMRCYRPRMSDDWQLTARPTAFEWDGTKDATNSVKHGLSFAESLETFLDPLLVIEDASRAGDGERRIKALGRRRGRLYAVTYTWRGTVARLISARRTNSKEDRSYGQNRPLRP